jgi:hypothetical protein
VIRTAFAVAKPRAVKCGWDAGDIYANADPLWLPLLIFEKSPPRDPPPPPRTILLAGFGAY